MRQLEFTPDNLLLWLKYLAHVEVRLFRSKYKTKEKVFFEIIFQPPYFNAYNERTTRSKNDKLDW